MPVCGPASPLILAFRAPDQWEMTGIVALRFEQTVPDSVQDFQGEKLGILSLQCLPPVFSYGHIPDWVPVTAAEWI